MAEEAAQKSKFVQRVGWSVSCTLYVVGDFDSESAVRAAHEAAEVLEKAGFRLVLLNDYEVSN